MVEISRLTRADEWEEAWPLLKSLRPALEHARFVESRDRLTAAGYELFGLRSAGRLVSVAGLVFYPHLERGLDCRLLDLVTVESERSKGHGKALVDHVERYARDRGCARVHLHTQFDRAETRRFYEERAGWSEGACVYQKSL